MTSTSDLINQYNVAFNEQFGGQHGVCSGLGAWILLALLAPAASGAHRTDLEKILGTDAQDAYDRAAQLLGERHPAVAAAAAVWSQDIFLTEAWKVFADRLPAKVERGPMPDQSGADEWARANTMGMIDSFPIEISPETVAVLANALATDVSWAEQFTLAAANELGGEFGSSIDNCLASATEHECEFYQTQSAGLVGVCVAEAAAGLRVLSVIADVTRSPADVHAAAAEVAASLSRQTSTAERVSLFDVPVGEGPAWTVTEEHTVALGAYSNRVEIVDALLVAWNADSRHDLLNAPGMPPALAALGGFLKPDEGLQPPEFEANQSAVASFSRVGFKAAAVTAIGMVMGSAAQTEAAIRRATIRFNRPYAVLCVALNHSRTDDFHTRYRELGCPNWQNMPVFSAWVGQPSEAVE